ncbi:hypothetical protein TNCV_1281051 [Trichonephila clavipes]|nr:hypothetical protein TNCV_1281051 [Trichonephila clavipes]
MLWSRQQLFFAVEAYFPNSRSVIAVQHAFRRHFDITPRDHVSDQKCFLMWMDAFQATGNALKERKGSSKAFKTPGNMEEFVCLFRLVCDNDQTMLTRSQIKGSKQCLITTIWDHSPLLQGFQGYFKSSPSQMTDFPVKERKPASPLTGFITS